MSSSWLELSGQESTHHRQLAWLCTTVDSQRRRAIPEVWRYTPQHRRQLALERTVKCRLQPVCPWFDTECHAIHHHCRRLECCYRRTGDTAHKVTYVAASCEKQYIWPEEATLLVRAHQDWWQFTDEALEVVELRCFSETNEQPTSSCRHAMTLMLSCISSTRKSSRSCINWRSTTARIHFIVVVFSWRVAVGTITV